MIKAADVMSASLVTVPYHATVSEAAKVMRDRQIGSVLVEQNGEVVGIVTETDIVRKVVGAGKLPGFIKSGSIMSRPVVTIQDRGPIIDVAELMHRHRTRHVAVTRDGSSVQGLVSVRDLLGPVSRDEL